MTARKKRIFGVVISLLLPIALFVSARFVSSEQNALADNEVHTLSTAQDILDLAASVNSDDNKLGEVYEITSDIDLSGYTFSPIGETSEVNHNIHHIFHGTINGNGHTITLDVSNKYKSAFIGNLGSSGTVNDLIIDGFVEGTGFVAGIVADNAGRVNRCINKAEITMAGTGSSTYTGGIVAQNNGMVSSCINFGDVNSSFHVGGIAGSSRSSGSIVSCINFGTIAANGTTIMYLGGIAGESQGGMTDSYSYAYINVSSSATSKYALGSLVGTTSGSNTYNNYVIDKEDAFSVLPPVWGNQEGIAGKFTKKTLYDFLYGEGVSFREDGLARAFFGQGYGYLYAPNFLLEEVGGVVSFVESEYDLAFRIPLFASGNGTFSSPYILSDEEEWNLFAENTLIHDYANTYVGLGKNFTTEIFFSCAENPFRGYFYGYGYTVTLDDTDATTSNKALFTYAEDSTFSDIVLSGEILGDRAIAGLVANGSGELTITDVVNRCYITGRGDVGGIVGAFDGTNLAMTDCINEADVACTTAGGSGRIGGMVGRVIGSVEMDNVFNYGSVHCDVSGNVDLGGLIGLLAVSTQDATIEAIHNETSVSASRTDNVGGLIGQINTYDGYTAEITSMSVFTTVVGRMNVGGIVGNIAGDVTLTGFAMIGTIRGQNHLSGIAGITSGTLTLDKGYFTGTFVEVQGSSTAAFRSDVLSNVKGGAVTVQDDVFYNEDDGNAATLLTGAVSKNGIQLTNGVFEGGLFTEIASTIGSGTYPYPTATASALQQTGRLKLNYFASVSGTTISLSNEQHVRNFFYFCRNVSAYAAYTYNLIANVTMTKPLSEIPTFTGRFNGNGYTLYNCAITSNSLEAGFFGSLQGAVISELKLEGGTLTLGGATHAGSICGQADETTVIEECYSSMRITGTSTYVGGLVGYLTGSLNTSFYVGRVVGTTCEYVGGLIGYLKKDVAHGSIENCFFSGKISSYGNAGGLVGLSTDGSISGAMIAGRVEGTNDAIVGGIVARAASTTVENVVVLADVVGNNTKGAFFAVSDSTSQAVYDCYYNLDKIAVSAYPGVANNGEYAKTSDYFMNTLIAEGFVSVPDNVLVGEKYNADCNAYYSKILDSFKPYTLTGASTYDAKIASYVLRSAELYIFGKDTSSDAIYGSAGNPYLITEATQFAALYELTKYNSFTGVYFRIVNDIDMNETNLNGYAIGYYATTGTNNGFAFRGVVYGDPANRPTIKNVSVDKASTSRTGTSTTKDFVGLFAHVESGFALRDLIFTGSVSGRTYVGGLVGYGYNVVIENCLSYISVSATGEQAGGLVGTSEGSFSVTGSICAGTVTATTDAYGIVGDKNLTGAVSENSWFVVSGSEYETYTHNSIGSILYDFSGAGQELSILSLTGGFGFIASSETTYKGHIMDTADKYIAPAHTEAYRGTVTGNVVRHYCVRYCTEITSSVELANGSSASAYASLDTSGYFYVGQGSTITLTWTAEGKSIGYKYLGVKDNLDGDVPVQLEPAAGSIIVNFVMTENTASTTILIGRISEGDVLTFTDEEGDPVASGTQYDGTERTPEFFDENASWDIEFYLVSTEEQKSVIREAGVYRVVLSLREGIDYVGLYETTYTVSPRTLTIPDAAALATERFTNTVYERGVATRTITFDTDDEAFDDVVGNVVEGESVSVSFLFTYASENAGENVGFVLTACSTTDDNYAFTGFTAVDLGSVGTIEKKTIVLTLDHNETEDDTYVLTRTFEGRGQKPVVDTATYEIAVTWLYKDNDITVTDFSVGTYSLVAKPTYLADEANYSLVTDKTYAVRIVPYVISTFDFSAVENSFVYTGSSLKSAIEQGVTYSSPLDNGLRSVTLVFYPTLFATEPCEDVLNAGNYYALPIPTDANYATSDEMQRTLIVVSKKTVGTLTVRFLLNGVEVESGSTVCTEDRLELDLSADELTVAGVSLFDGTYRANRHNFRMEYDEDEGKWYMIPNAGEANVDVVVIGESATNYVDRYSETFTFTVTKRHLYAILQKDEFLYGDDILKELEVDYYYIGENGVVGDMVEKRNISGLEKPGISLGTEVFPVGTYTVSFSGGSSDGYTFDYYTNLSLSSEKKVTVLPKPISVVVSDAGSKVYGTPRAQENVSYTLAYVDPVDGILKTLTQLPNGNEPVLQGKLGREAGEAVGEYALTSGTMPELNPNYSLEFTFGGKFTIIKREIVLNIKTGQGKQYGDPDGILEFVVADGYSLVNDEDLGVYDTMAVFANALFLSREEGETVGAYRYYVSENNLELSLLNYLVSVSSDSLANARFTITTTRPIVNFEVSGKVHFGDSTDQIPFRSSVTDKYGTEVEGTFELYVFDTSVQGRRRTMMKKDDTIIIAQFTPKDNNYEVVNVNAPISVDKRPVTVEILCSALDIEQADGAQFEYAGTKYTVSMFTYDVIGLVNAPGMSPADPYDVELSMSGDTKNVTKEGFYVTAELVSDYYVLADECSIHCTIVKSQVTVTVENAVIEYGETYVPTISYSGFKSGETANVLSKKATVTNVPTESGYHSITASGAEANNYTFRYVPGVLTINRAEASSDGIRIQGTLSPTFTVTANELEAETVAFSETSSEFDKKLGANLFLPISKKMKTYVRIESTDLAEAEEYTYTVRLSKYDENDVIYLQYENGTIREAEDYEVTETDDGYEVTFASTRIIGVATYEGKDQTELLKGYIPLGIAGLVVVVILVLVIIFSVMARKSRKREKTRYSYHLGYWK